MYSSTREVEKLLNQFSLRGNIVALHSCGGILVALSSRGGNLATTESSTGVSHDRPLLSNNSSSSTCWPTAQIAAAVERVL